jgi:hypothetical protein
MRNLILSLCALWSALAAAQGQCIPADFSGTGTKAVLELNATGGAVAWWCPGRFKPTLSLYAVRWDAMSEPLRADLNALVASPDQTVAGIDRMRATHATVPLNDAGLRLVWEPARARMLASRPSNPLWLVARNGIVTTRPAYTSAGGVRQAMSSTRATVGVSCGCLRLNIVEGQMVYCGFDNTSQLVTLCTRQPD